MAPVDFRPGQWVVLNDVVGLLYKRRDKRFDGTGKLILAAPGEPGIMHDFGSSPDHPEPDLQRVAVDVDVEFHPVRDDDDGSTNHAEIVRHLDLANPPATLRQARISEIPEARRPALEVAMLLGYEP